jgi:hypothetical protein
VRSSEFRFHLGPLTALKFRGIRRSKRIERDITEASLGSYVLCESAGKGSLADPRVAFAFTYLASHFALDLLNEQQIAELMDYIESHPDQLGAAENASASNAGTSLHPFHQPVLGATALTKQ